MRENAQLRAEPAIVCRLRGIVQVEWFSSEKERPRWRLPTDAQAGMSNYWQIRGELDIHWIVAGFVGR